MAFPNVDLKLKWEDQNIIKKDGQWTVDGRPTVVGVVSHIHYPPNLPNTTWLGLLITAPVNAATPPHKHAGASVVATVIRGHVLNQMVHSHTDRVTGEVRTHDGGAKIYGPGESWYEAPGCHHVRSETVGDEEAVFVANLLVGNEVFDGIEKSEVGPEADFKRFLRIFIIDKDLEEAAAAAAKQ